MNKKGKVILIILCIFLFQQILYAKYKRKTIMIDLDGVLDNYIGYTKEIPKIRNGAKEFVKELSDNYELILFTTRNTKQAVEWLQSNKIDKYFKEVTNVKRPAFIYIDDRALNFNGDYNEALKDIEKFNAYWEKQ